MKQGWQVLPMTGFNHGLNPGLNRVGQNPKNPDPVGKTGQNYSSSNRNSLKSQQMYGTQ